MTPFFHEPTWRCTSCGWNNHEQVSKCWNCKAPWPQPTQSQCDKEPSSCHGTSASPVPFLTRSTQLNQIFDQVTVLRRMFAGTSSAPFGNGQWEHWQDGQESVEQRLEAAISASIARLQSQVYNLYTRAIIVETNMILSLEEDDCNIFKPGKTP